MQVVAPKHPTTVVMPNHIGFAHLFSQGTDSVAIKHFEAATDKIVFFRKKNWKQANSIFLLRILPIYTYISSFMQIQQKFQI